MKGDTKFISCRCLATSFVLPLTILHWKHEAGDDAFRVRDWCGTWGTHCGHWRPNVSRCSSQKCVLPFWPRNRPRTWQNDCCLLEKKSPSQWKGCRQWSFSMNLQLNIMQKWIVYPKYHVIPNTFCCIVNFLSRFLNGVETVQSHYEIVRHAEYFFAGQKCGLAVVRPLYFMWTEHLAFIKPCRVQKWMKISKKKINVPST